MSQSVKLRDGSYIDASGVWDNTQGKTQEEINNGQEVIALGELHTLNVTDYFTTATGGTLYWQKYGHIVIVSVKEMTVPSAGYYTASLASLGMPVPTCTFNAAACCDGNFVGQIYCGGTNLSIICRSTTPTKINIGATVTYLTTE